MSGYHGLDQGAAPAARGVAPALGEPTRPGQIGGGIEVRCCPLMQRSRLIASLDSMEMRSMIAGAQDLTF